MGKATGGADEEGGDRRETSSSSTALAAIAAAAAAPAKALLPSGCGGGGNVSGFGFQLSRKVAARPAKRTRRENSGPAATATVKTEKKKAAAAAAASGNEPPKRKRKSSTTKRKRKKKQDEEDRIPVPSFCSSLERLEREFFSEDDDGDGGESKASLLLVPVASAKAAATRTKSAALLLDSDSSDDDFLNDLLSINVGFGKKSAATAAAATSNAAAASGSAAIAAEKTKSSSSSSLLSQEEEAVVVVAAAANGCKENNINLPPQRGNDEIGGDEGGDDDDGGDAFCEVFHDDDCDDDFPPAAQPETSDKSSLSTNGGATAAVASSGGVDARKVDAGANLRQSNTGNSNSAAGEEHSGSNKNTALLKAVRDVFAESDVHTITVKQVLATLREKHAGGRKFDKQTKKLIRDELTRLVKRVASAGTTSSAAAATATSEAAGGGGSGGCGTVAAPADATISNSATAAAAAGAQGTSKAVPPRVAKSKGADVGNHSTGSPAKTASTSCENDGCVGVLRNEDVPDGPTRANSSRKKTSRNAVAATAGKASGPPSSSYNTCAPVSTAAAEVPKQSGRTNTITASRSSRKAETGTAATAIATTRAATSNNPLPATPCSKDQDAADPAVQQPQKRRRGWPAKPKNAATKNPTSTAAAKEKPSRKRKARCQLCSSCPCTFADGASGTEARNLSSLSQSDAAIERALMRRLHKLEQITERHEDQTDAVRRKLKKHRREMWRKYEESQKSLNPGKESRFLPDAQEIDRQWDGFESKRLGPKAVAKAKRTVFASSTSSTSSIGNYQPTLTQMLGRSTRREEDQPPDSVDNGCCGQALSTIDEEETEEKSTSAASEVNVAPPNSQDNETVVDFEEDDEPQERDKMHCPLDDEKDDENRREEETEDALLNVLRIEVRNGVEEGDQTARIWGSYHGDFHCPFDLFLLASDGSSPIELDKDTCLAGFPLTAEEDEPGKIDELLQQQQEAVDMSMLSQRGKLLVDKMIADVVKDSTKLAAVESACPNWRENVMFALHQREAGDLTGALSGVKKAKAKLQRTKAAVIRAAQEQEMALEVFESALTSSLSRLNETEDKHGFFPSQTEPPASPS